MDLYVTKKSAHSLRRYRARADVMQNTSKNPISCRGDYGRERKKNLRKSIFSRSAKQERELWRTISRYYTLGALSALPDPFYFLPHCNFALVLVLPCTRKIQAARCNCDVSRDTRISSVSLPRVPFEEFIIQSLACKRLRVIRFP